MVQLREETAVEIDLRISGSYPTPIYDLSVEIVDTRCPQPMV
jgi:hypothetical protein